MKVAIHNTRVGFTRDWVTYCSENHIPFKLVNCYANNIVDQVRDCDIVLWHHHHTHVKDFLFAREFLFALAQAGKRVFPDFNSGWHFDDKVGQKYLLEAVQAPIAKTYVFFDVHEANEWAGQTTFPKVFKLRGGAGSTNVRLVRNASQARKMIRKAFRTGFSSYNRWADLHENVRRWRLGKSTYINVLKSVRRVFVSTSFARTAGNQKGYVYFQDFLPGNTFDIRIVTIGERAFGIKRLTRENDFRASGSGFILYDRREIPEQCVKIAFEVSEKLKASVVAYDFVFDERENPLIVEINYGYAHEAYFKCPGYWDRAMNWHGQTFNSAHWIIEEVVNRFKVSASQE